MVKHIQTVHRLLPANCLSVFDHFVGLARKGLTQRVRTFIYYLDHWRLVYRQQLVEWQLC